MADMTNMMGGGAPAPSPEQAAAQTQAPNPIPGPAPQQSAPAQPGMMFPVLDGPTPGQSLLGEPRSKPWERPPQFVEVEDALDYIWRMLCKPAVTKSTLTMLSQGMSVEAMARTLLFTGFAEGKWSWDMCMLMGRSVCIMIAGLGKAAGIKMKLYMNKPDPTAPIRSVLKNTLPKSLPSEDAPAENKTGMIDVLAKNKGVVKRRKGAK